MDSEWRKKSLIVKKVNGAVQITTELLPAMPEELRQLLGDEAK